MPVLPNTRLVQVATTANPFRFVTDDLDLGQIHRCHVKSCVIPNSEYNVNNKTNTVDITAGDMAVVGNLPVGQYDITTFLAALKVILDVAANPNTFTITQNNLTKKLTFVKSGGNEFTIGLESQISRLIGQVPSKTSVGLTLTTDSIPDLSGMRIVVFKSFTLGRFKISSGDTALEKRKTNTIGSLPMTAAFGSLMKVEQTEETLNATSFQGYKNVSNFDIALVDEDDELLELNGVEYLLEFEMHNKGAT